MFGEARSAAVSKVRTSLGSRQDAVGLTPIYAKISLFGKTRLYFFLIFFVFSRGHPKWWESYFFKICFRILIIL